MILLGSLILFIMFVTKYSYNGKGGEDEGLKNEGFYNLTKTFKFTLSGFYGLAEQAGYYHMIWVVGNGS